jgi:endoribonuclease Dicer
MSTGNKKRIRNDSDNEEENELSDLKNDNKTSAPLAIEKDKEKKENEDVENENDKNQNIILGNKTQNKNNNSNDDESFQNDFQLFVEGNKILDNNVFKNEQFSNTYTNSPSEPNELNNNINNPNENENVESIIDSILNEEGNKEEMNFSQFKNEKLIVEEKKENIIEKKTLIPRNYQLKIYNEAKDRNSIIFMETGKGKTFLSIMLMSRVLGIDIVENPNIDISKIDKSKKIIFLICDTALVKQQSEAISKILGIEVGILQGKKQKKSKNDYFEFRKLWESKNIFVAIHNVIYKLLSCGFLRFSEISMLIFDECHHADSSHPYNDIMNEFYFFYKKKNDTNLPLILGLTASPLKTSIKSDIQLSAYKAFNTLSENLDSEIVIDQDEKVLNLELKNENDVEQFLEKERFIQVLEDYDCKEYKIILLILKKYLFQNLNKFVIEFLKKNEELKDILKDFNNFEVEYNSFIEEKFKCDSLLTYNDVINRYMKLYELKNYSSVLRVSEKIQRQIFLILHNLDLTCLINYFYRFKNYFLNLIIKKSNEKNIAIEEKDIIPEEIKDLKIVELKQLLSIFGKTQEKISEMLEKKLDFSCNRVKQMLNELEKIFNENSKSKIIIFVENRIVAYYLEGIVTKFLIEKYNNQYKCTTVIGVNKIKNENGTLFNPSNSIKDLNDKINAFNKSEFNILIGTNAVEEGLDIQSCNIVMVFTELRTPKSYVQMKGRARKENSKFLVFSCVPENTKKNIQYFIILNIIMKQIFNDGIRKDFRRKNFIQEKTIDLCYFIETSQAKITSHNCSFFYNEMIQILNNNNYNTKCEIKVEKIKRKVGPNEFDFIGNIKINSVIKGLNKLNNIKTKPRASKSAAENECKFYFVVMLIKLKKFDDHIKFVR